MKKRIIRIAGILIVAIGVFIFYLWNKPPETVDNKDAQQISAINLSDEFLTDEKKANNQYLNKVLSVTGTITEINKNQDNQTVILLAGSDVFSGVQCTMRENNDQTFEIGKTITVKGFCHGYTLVVLLSECILL